MTGRYHDDQKLPRVQRLDMCSASSILVFGSLAALPATWRFLCLCSRLSLCSPFSFGLCCLSCFVRFHISVIRMPCTLCARAVRVSSNANGLQLV